MGESRGQWSPDYQQIGQKPSLQILKIQIQAQIKMQLEIRIQIQVQLKIQYNTNSNINREHWPPYYQQRGQQQLPRLKWADLGKAEKIKGRQARHHKEATLDTNLEKTCNLQKLRIFIWLICSTLLLPVKNSVSSKRYITSHTYHIK